MLPPNLGAREKSGYKLTEDDGKIKVLVFDLYPFNDALHFFSKRIGKSIKVAAADAEFASNLKAYISIVDTTWSGGLNVLAYSYGFRLREASNVITLYYAGTGRPEMAAPFAR